MSRSVQLAEAHWPRRRRRCQALVPMWRNRFVGHSRKGLCPHRNPEQETGNKDGAKEVKRGYPWTPAAGDRPCIPEEVCRLL